MVMVDGQCRTFVPQLVHTQGTYVLGWGVVAAHLVELGEMSPRQYFMTAALG
jgi:hypothetical protein